VPVLLLSAPQPLVEGAGFIVPTAERDDFLAQVGSASLVEVDANHYGINTHPAASEAIAAFLGLIPGRAPSRRRGGVVGALGAVLATGLGAPTPSPPSSEIWSRRPQA